MNDFKIISWDEIAEGTACFFPGGTAVTIGGFDGPHRGHRKLFGYVLGNSAKDTVTPGIITFIRPPSAIRNTASYSGDVSTLRLRLKKFRELGFKFIVLIDFSAGFAKIDGVAFLDVLAKTIRIKYLAVGNDFFCGYQRGLGTEQLKELAPRMGFRFDSVGSVNAQDGSRISSTAIREAVAAGNFARAKDLLGYPFLFDITAPSWAVSGTDSISAPKSLLTQILPPCGAYKVFLSSFNGEKKEAVFYMEQDMVRLVFSGLSNPLTMENLNRFDTIEFICKE